MKKYILIIILIPSILFSEIKGYIEIGKDINSNISYTELQIGYNFYLSDFIIYPYGNQMTWFEFYDRKGNPFRDIYTIGIDTKYKGLTFNLSHFCSHFVRSDYEQYHRYNDVPLGGRLTKISVRYDY